MDPHDYRDFRIAGSRRGNFGRILRLALGLLAVVAMYLAFAWGVRDRGRVQTAGVALRAGDRDGAAVVFSALRDHRLYARSANDGLGLVAALGGDLAGAAKHFDSSDSERVWLGRLPWTDLAHDAVERGDYETAEVIASRGLIREGDGPDLHLFRGLARNGLDRLSEAREDLSWKGLRSVFEEVSRGKRPLIGGVFRDAGVLEMYVNHIEELARKERVGLRTYIFDRADKPLARVVLKTGADAEAPAAMAPALNAIRLDLDARARQGRVMTTLDPEIQKLAFRSLRGQRGSIVVLDMDGAILAATARDDRKRRQPGDALPDPLHDWFPLGSVAKLATLTAAAATPSVLLGRFPFTCDRGPRLDGKPFYDWTRHGTVPTLDEALAVSCNIAFAEIGLALGRERLLASFAKFGFTSGDPGSGQASIVGDISTEIELARFAVGLDHTRTTLRGAAAMALAVATGGEYRETFLVRSIATTGGTPLASHRPVGHRLVDDQASGSTLAAITSAMRAVVENERGTARRARPELWTAAAKTGTTGSSKEGLDAVIVGFAPVDRPRYAFAAYLPKSGRSEWVAADVARQLLDSLQAYDDDRMRARDTPW